MDARSRPADQPRPGRDCGRRRAAQPNFSPDAQAETKAVANAGGATGAADPTARTNVATTTTNLDVRTDSDADS